jgi:hypothetical protein
MRVVTHIPDNINKYGRKTHHAKKANAGVKDFIAVDGESITTWIGHIDSPPDPEIRYGQLAVGDHIIEDWTTRHEIKCANGITKIVHGLFVTQIFEHLYKYGGTYRIANIGFYLGFDFTQWLKTLPESRARLLLTEEGKRKRARTKSGDNHTPFWTEYQGWEFDILDKKRFKLRKKYCGCFPNFCDCKRGPTMFICDTGPFWQCSLLKAIDPKGWKIPVVTDQEFDTLKTGKDSRGKAQPGKEMREYNILENDVLVRITKELDASFKKAGVYLSAKQWMGPGQSAEEWLSNVVKLTLSKELLGPVPQYILDNARMSYFGGWFEIMMHGIVPGNTYEYDINSAYPFAIGNLPCLKCATYSQGIGKPDVEDNEIAFVYARLKGNNPYIGTMLHRRDDMSILRPANTEGWFVYSELEMAIRAGLIDEIDYIEWSKITVPCTHKPLEPILELYELRLSVDKNSAFGKALKLLYNSAYGKFAQSIGFPKFANSIYATLITSKCRERILEAIATHPVGASHVAMVATDGVYFVSPHTEIDRVINEYMHSTGKKSDDRIGMWERGVKKRITLFKPGVYWDDESRERILNGNIAKFKSRGISAIDLAPFIEEIDNEFLNWGDNPPGNHAYLMNDEISDPIELPSEDELRISLAKGIVPKLKIHPTKPKSDHYGWPTKRIRPRFAVISAKLALVRNNWSLAGTDLSNTTVLEHTSDPEMKRDGGAYVDYLEDGRRIYRSQPYELPAIKWVRLFGSEEAMQESIKSKPYDRLFGMDDPFSDEFLEQWGESQDGTIAQEINWALYE